MRIFDSLRRHFWTKSFALFLLIGCINTLNGALLSEAIAYVLPVNTAFVIGYTLANLIAYLLCGQFLFHASCTVRGYVKFAVSYIPNFLIQNLIVFISYNLYAVPSLAAFFLAAILGVPVTFLLVKLFAFGVR